MSPSSLWLLGNHCLTKWITTCSAHSRMAGHHERPLCTVPLFRCKHYIPRGVVRWESEYTSPSLPLFTADLPYTVSFLLSFLVHIILLSVRPAIWLLLVSSFIVRMPHDDVEVGIHNKTVGPHSSTCSLLVEIPFIPHAHFPRLTYMFVRQNWSAGTAVPPSKCRLTCASISSLACWGSYSIWRTYQFTLRA